MNFTNRYHGAFTMECCGFQIHNFAGNGGTLAAYFEALGIETARFRANGTQSKNGSVLAHHPYRGMTNDYPGHDIADSSDFFDYMEDRLPTHPEYTALPQFLASLQPEGTPCYLFCNRYEESRDCWNCVEHSVSFWVIIDHTVHQIDLLARRSGKITPASLIRGEIADEAASAAGVEFLTLQGFTQQGKTYPFFTRISPFANTRLSRRFY